MPPAETESSGGFYFDGDAVSVASNPPGLSSEADTATIEMTKNSSSSMFARIITWVGTQLLKTKETIISSKNSPSAQAVEASGDNSGVAVFVRVCVYICR
eukprot:GHVQ01041041.1.p2 GENE.GHVQ01041041.1~~GHVQ01041041.1.p2  ORF type:complete len:100 (+),score=9.24 GHVQ01041041.1:208-507(+)